MSALCTIYVSVFHLCVRIIIPYDVFSFTYTLYTKIKSQFKFKFVWFFGFLFLFLKWKKLMLQYPRNNNHLVDILQKLFVLFWK